MNVWGWVLAVHVLCAVIWVGGMFFAYVVLRPSLSVLEPIQRIALHTQIFRRFFLIVWHVMPLILLSGFAALFGLFGGPATAPWNISVMMLLGLIMSAIFLADRVRPLRAFPPHHRPHHHRRQHRSHPQADWREPRAGHDHRGGGIAALTATSDPISHPAAVHANYNYLCSCMGVAIPRIRARA